MSSRLEDLERLARLRESGVLSEQEFHAQKAMILSEPAVLPSMVPAPSVASDEEDPEFSWNLFEPPSSLKAAVDLTQAATFAAIAIAVDELITVGLSIRTSFDGETIDPEFSNTTVIGLGLGLALFWGAVSALAAWWVVNRHSRAAAVLLLMISVIGLVASIETRWVAGGLVVKLTLLVAGGSIYLAIQAVRGVFGVRRFEPEGAGRESRVGQSPTVTVGTALKAGVSVSRPFRHLLRWIGLGIVVLMGAIAAFVWFAARHATPTTASASLPMAVQPIASGVDAEFLEGPWEPNNQDCSDCYFLGLQPNGVFSVENAGGTWSFDQGQLAITSRYEEMGGEETTGPWVTDVASVERVSDTEIRVTFTDRPPVLYRRYPDDGSSAWD